MGNSYLNCSGYSLDNSLIIEIHTESNLIYYFYSLFSVTIIVMTVTEPVHILRYKVCRELTYGKLSVVINPHGRRR